MGQQHHHHSCNDLSVFIRFVTRVCGFLTVVKKRLVKLVVNFLFYFRTDEEEVRPR